MIRPGALEIGAGRRRKEGALTDDSGVHEGSVLGRPENVNLLNNAVMNAVAPLFDARTDESGQHLHLSDFR